MRGPNCVGLADDIWKSLREFVEQDLLSETRPFAGISPACSSMSVASSPKTQKIRADMNEGFVVALSSFVESQKSGVSTFIAEQVKRWDLAQLTRLIEINIGRDLQYIRFNGMLIGGLAGLAAARGRTSLLCELTCAVTSWPG